MRSFGDEIEVSAHVDGCQRERGGDIHPRPTWQFGRGQGIANGSQVVKLDLGVRKLIAQRLAKRFEKHTFGYR